MSVLVAKELSSVLGSRLTIGRINIGLLNRIIIDDLMLNDQSGKELLKVGRLSAKFEILPLFNGRISIGNVQLFSFNANLEKPTPQATSNFQFVLDAFASKDTVKKKSNLDLRINSLLIRRGRVSYDVLSAERTPGKFNPQHIRLSNILANISLKALQSDSINAAIKRMSVEEDHSGFELKKLSLKIVANNKKMWIDNFAIDLPNPWQWTLSVWNMTVWELSAISPMMSASLSTCCLRRLHCRIYLHLYQPSNLSGRRCNWK